MDDTATKNIPNCFYRISIKALILNETHDKFLIVQEEDGRWELPGGGLGWGMTPQEDLPREIAEEMGLEVIKVADRPSYFLCTHVSRGGYYKADVLYETELSHLDFIPSDECIAIRFVGPNDKAWLAGQDTFPNVIMLLNQFSPKNHTT